MSVPEIWYRSHMIILTKPRSHGGAGKAVELHHHRARLGGVNDSSLRRVKRNPTPLLPARRLAAGGEQMGTAISRLLVQNHGLLRDELGGGQRLGYMLITTQK